jgi:hypothetical protein
MAWLKIGRTLAATLSVLTLMGGSPGAVASTASHGSGRILEVNVTNSPEVRNGQPAVAVNPRNPRNLVFTATVFTPGVPTPPGECFLAHSMDRGETWTRVPWPLGDRPACGEPNLAVDARGTFYVLSNQLGPDSTANIFSNNVVVSRSHDGGRTWSEPVQTPLRIGGTPKLRVDAATGKVYAVGGFSWLLPSGVSVSADRGNTWSPPALIPGPLPCSPSPVPGLPDICGFPGRQIAVHAGILAAATQEEGVDFHVSSDDGQSWTSSPVTASDGAPVPAGVGPLVPGTPTGGAAADPVPWVSADPTRAADSP